MALTSAAAIEKRLKTLGDPERAKFVQGFFKTKPGQYGAGDKFLGLSVPQVRAVARDLRGLPLTEIDALLHSPWHEVRLLAVVLLANRYPKSDAKTQDAIYRLYLSRTDRINNWDLVDVSAPQIVGAHLMERSRAPLRKLAKSKSLWERRIAVVATHHFIRHDDFAETIALAEQLLDDGQDLMHKAVGWMLREVGKRDERVLTAFLDRHAADMPRTALRYAVERLTPARRQTYMAVPRRTTRR